MMVLNEAYKTIRFLTKQANYKYIYLMLTGYHITNIWSILYYAYFAWVKCIEAHHRKKIEV